MVIILGRGATVPEGRHHLLLSGRGSLGGLVYVRVRV